MSGGRPLHSSPLRKLVRPTCCLSCDRQARTAGCSAALVTTCGTKPPPLPLLLLPLLLLRLSLPLPWPLSLPRLRLRCLAAVTEPTMAPGVE